MKCTKCFNAYRGYNTGEVAQAGYLDCADCTAATERATLNTSMEAAGGMIKTDEHWHAYQIGRSAAVAELLPMLRKMWGHAIELGETDYFDDPQFGKADWSADCEAAHLVIAKYRKTLA